MPWSLFFLSIYNVLLLLTKLESTTTTLQRQKNIKTVDCKGRTDSKEGESNSVSWQSDSHSLLGFQWGNFCGLPGER